MVLIIKILFTAMWLTAGYEAFEEADDLMDMMITAMIVSIPLYLLWLC